MQLFLKILSEMADSVDPDQTAPPGAVWSGSALFAHAFLSDTLMYEILGPLLYLIEKVGKYFTVKSYFSWTGIHFP